MARAKSERARKGSSSGRLRSGVSAAALLILGSCVGVVLGSLLDGPRVFLRHLLEPSQSVEVARAPSVASTNELTEYRALQQTEPPAGPPDPPAGPPSDRTPTGAGPRANSPAPAPQRPDPPPVAAAPVSSEPRARDLIERIAARRAATAVGTGAQGKAPPAGSGLRVVQVAAFRDLGSAQALVRRLRRSGFDSYLSDTQPEGEERFRVRVRPGDDADVESLASELRGRGFGVWVTTE